MIYVQDLWPENLQVLAGVKSKIIIKIINRMVDKIYTNADRILVTSNSFRNSVLNRGIAEDKCKVWFQYAEDFYKPLKTIYRESNEILKIIFTGNIGEAQGLEILPKVSLILDKYGYKDKVKFIIVGDGRNKENLLSQISILNTSDMFEFFSSIPANQVPDMLSKADVAFVSFLNNDLFMKTIPAKLQSYMACGMPILAVSGGETENIISVANCGLNSQPDDVESLANNIIRFLASSKEDLIEMSKNSLKYYKNNFDKYDLLSQFDNIIKEI